MFLPPAQHPLPLSLITASPFSLGNHLSVHMVCLELTLTLAAGLGAYIKLGVISPATVIDLGMGHDLS